MEIYHAATLVAVMLHVESEVCHEAQGVVVGWHNGINGLARIAHRLVGFKCRHLGSLPIYSVARSYPQSALTVAHNVVDRAVSRQGVGKCRRPFGHGVVAYHFRRCGGDEKPSCTVE